MFTRWIPGHSWSSSCKQCSPSRYSPSVASMTCFECPPRTSTQGSVDLSDCNLTPEEHSPKVLVAAISALSKWFVDQREWWLQFGILRMPSTKGFAYGKLPAVPQGSGMLWVSSTPVPAFGFMTTGITSSDLVSNLYQCMPARLCPDGGPNRCNNGRTGMAYKKCPLKAIRND